MYNIFEETLFLSSDVCTLCLSQNKDSREIFTFLVEIEFYSLKPTNNIMLMDSGRALLNLVTSNVKEE